MGTEVSVDKSIQLKSNCQSLEYFNHFLYES